MFINVVKKFSNQIIEHGTSQLLFEYKTAEWCEDIKEENNNFQDIK